MPNWTLAEAIALCRKVEAVAPKCGCHVALTGGLLYRDGERKDCDLVFYRIRQSSGIDKEKLFEALGTCGVFDISGFGWCHKGQTADGKHLDLFFPEETAVKGEPEYALEEAAAKEVANV